MGNDDFDKYERGDEWEKKVPHEELMDTTQLFFPRIRSGPHLAHYYGDQVRMFFVGIAAVMLVLAPFWDSALYVSIPVDIGSALVLVILAAMTHPKKEFVMLLNTIVAAVGTAANEVLALVAYFGGSPLVFIGREAIVVGFIFALYFSLKTLRAMWLGQIGRREPPGEMREEIGLGDFRRERSRENRRSLWN